MGRGGKADGVGDTWEDPLTSYVKQLTGLIGDQRTAGFLFDLGVTFEWAEVQLLARLGGWEPHKDRLPGKRTLQRGLGRLLEMLSTQAILSGYATQHQGLPPGLLLCYTAGSLLAIYEWMSEAEMKRSYAPTLP